MRPIDADAYAAEMQKRQEACKEWLAATDEGDEMHVRAQQSLAAFCEACLTLDKMPTMEAIPMSWINEKLLDMKKKDMALSAAVWLTRRAWLEEQG